MRVPRSILPRFAPLSMPVGCPTSTNHRLVRGLDYYTRTTFEFVYDEPGEGGLGSQNALLGGGRYDGLSEAIGGPKAPGIGFAIGEDRLVLVLEAQGRHHAPAGSGLYRSAGRTASIPPLWPWPANCAPPAYGPNWAMDRFG